jgi:anaerobic sulfite reductase subunit C
MKWTEDAENAIKKVPFFVRKKVRARVEKDATELGRNRITLDIVQSSRKRFLSSMASEIKGYQIDTCFSNGDCPNTCVSGDKLISRLTRVLEEEDLLTFIKQRVTGDLKFHHEFRVTLAECPNACSQPQIKDIGIIAAQHPRVGDTPCSSCGACVDICKEKAVSLPDEADRPDIDFSTCVSCGACIRACPTGTLETHLTGFRVLLGGRLGRHPRLARELDGLFNEDQVIEILRKCIAHYKKHSTSGQRFSALFDDEAFDDINIMFS